MSKPTVKFDSRAIEQWMRDNLTEMTRAATQKIAAAAASASGVFVDGQMFETDRPHGVVMVKDHRSHSMVARDGLLIRQAKAAGLEVRQR